ncbi:hypothetical protein DEM34_18825 [Spiribacter halobius]|uniref:Transposase zinc-ribbon domain-containing protein n=1 Tax=Sediminicurvatus halobius TaxID=2182432 RepID=A0A2U2MVV5_9GAMM|nr:hypothetical protein DEM34_18825 [Spiribacter halobius]
MPTPHRSIRPQGANDNGERAGNSSRLPGGFLISNDRQLPSAGAIRRSAYTDHAFSIQIRESPHAHELHPVSTRLSMPKFLRLYRQECQCAAALEQARWPAGLRLPRCHVAAYSRVQGRTHTLFQCRGCRHQTSLIAGAVMRGTKLPLTVRFLAICLLSQAKTGLSALALARHLGVSYPSAWLMHHKLTLRHGGA